MPCGVAQFLPVVLVGNLSLHSALDAANVDDDSGCVDSQGESS